MRQGIGHIIAVVLLAVVAAGTCAHAAQTAPTPDVRVLVDVSGSMRQTDPHNLRRAALRLLFGLAPEDTRVGMWSFAQYTNMQLKPAFASRDWKQAARKEADSVHSHGLFTNIEDVLRRSSWDWTRPDPYSARHMILLTDGKVDISKQAAVNDASRQRILTEILPALQAAGVKVHTVALSAQADHAMLQAMARATGGWYERVDDADGLQRVFLRLFEKASPTDTLPLLDNRFRVDAAITDMTLLVFHPADSKPVRILTPSGKVQLAERHLATIEWFKEQGFDLVTIKAPEPGEWSIDAAVDPDNRVRIVSNLRLDAAELPNELLVGESLDLQARLQASDGAVTDKDMLAVVEFSGRVFPADHRYDYEYRLSAIDPGQGSYGRRTDGLDYPLTHEVILSARSQTFERSRRYTVQVLPLPLETSIEPGENDFTIHATLIHELLDPGSVQLGLILPGAQEAQAMNVIPAAGWQARVDKHYQGMEVGVAIDARLRSGQSYHRVINLELPAVATASETGPVPQEAVTVLNMPDTGFENPYVQAELAQAEPVVEPEPVAIQHPEESVSTAETRDQPATDWLWVITGLVLGNLLIIGAGIFAYLRFVREPAESMQDLEGDAPDPLTEAAATTSATAAGASAGASTELHEPGQPAADAMASRDDRGQSGESPLADTAADAATEDYSEMRRGETGIEPVSLDEGDDIPEFDISDEDVEPAAAVKPEIDRAGG